MAVRARRGLLGLEMTSVVRYEHLPGLPQAGAASALVLGHAGVDRVGAVTADEPPILIGDHGAEVDSRHAIRAADGQDCVGWHRALLHLREGDWHAGFQTPRPAIPLKNKGSQDSDTVVEPKPRRDSGRRADRRADRTSGRNGPSIQHWVKNEGNHRLIEPWDCLPNSPPPTPKADYDAAPLAAGSFVGRERVYILSAIRPGD
jgi:hypothetical protein